MENQKVILLMKRIGGVSLIFSPLTLIIGFAMHFQNIGEFFVFKLKYVQVPIEESVKMLMSSEAARNFINPHLVAYFAVPFMIFASLAIGYLIFKQKPWIAFIGTAMTVIGSVFIGGVFAAWLSFAAIGNMALDQFEYAVSAFKELTTMQGPLVLISYLSIFSLLGFMVLAVGLFKSSIVPKWSASLLFIGYLIIIAFMDLDNLMLIGAVLILIGSIPISKLLFKRDV